MRNFVKLGGGLNITSALQGLALQSHLWNLYPVRKKSVHGAADDILLRFNKYKEGDDLLDKVLASIDCVDYPAWYELPQLHQFIYTTMALVQGLHLGRVIVTRLPPGGHIPPHSDRIAEAEEKFPSREPPARYYERYHCVFQSEPGCVFRCGNEQVWMQAGELWWFNNELEHEVVNNSALDRLHLILDVRTRHDSYVPE